MTSHVNFKEERFILHCYRIVIGCSVTGALLALLGNSASIKNYIFPGEVFIWYNRVTRLGLGGERWDLVLVR